MKNFKWLLLAFVIVLLDQFSKLYVVRTLVLQEPVAIFSWLNANLNYNTGVAFSMLSSAGSWKHWALGVFSFMVCLVLLIWVIRTDAQHKCVLLALTFILGGAVGNLIDRVMHSYVIDFIDFHLGNWHFFTFNVADASITIGAILLGALLIFKKV